MYTTMASTTRITELQNELTTEIDTCNPVGIVRTLCQSDAQLFAGWGSHACVGDAAVLEKIDKLANKTATLLKENNCNGANNIFVFTGCGTSGRIAWACSRSFNNLLSRFGLKPCCHYLIAGGDPALIVGKELPEDDPPQGAKDLQDISQSADHVVLFGITCGLSAPYVAGQIDYGMKQANYTTVLIGFNPVQLARSAPIEKWHKTCKDTFTELHELELKSDRGMILNPIVGPEPITEPLFAGFALKLILNAISTGANILKGKVVRNTMINLTVANDKLFYRSIGIIRELSGVDEQSAHTALLRSIYREDDITKYSSEPVSKHITAATQQTMVVPFAIILASKRCSIEEGTSIITQVKSLRTLVQLSGQ